MNIHLNFIHFGHPLLTTHVTPLRNLKFRSFHSLTRMHKLNEFRVFQFRVFLSTTSTPRKFNQMTNDVTCSFTQPTQTQHEVINLTTSPPSRVSSLSPSVESPDHGHVMQLNGSGHVFQNQINGHVMYPPHVTYAIPGQYPLGQVPLQQGQVQPQMQFPQQQFNPALNYQPVPFPTAGFNTGCIPETPMSSALPVQT